jgi:hypothetical protein
LPIPDWYSSPIIASSDIIAARSRRLRNRERFCHRCRKEVGDSNSSLKSILLPL